MKFSRTLTLTDGNEKIIETIVIEHEAQEFMLENASVYQVLCEGKRVVNKQQRVIEHEHPLPESA